jgi:hypothetical protein
LIAGRPVLGEQSEQEKADGVRPRVYFAGERFSVTEHWLLDDRRAFRDEAQEKPYISSQSRALCSEFTAKGCVVLSKAFSSLLYFAHAWVKEKSLRG